MNTLADFASHEFRLNKVGEDGVSLRDTLAVIERRTGVMPAEGINPVELPPECVQLWAWFLQLNQERAVSDMGGPRPLTSANLLAWMQLEGVRLEGWEILAIRRLDQVALASCAEDMKKNQARARPAGPGRPTRGL